LEDASQRGIPSDVPRLTAKEKVAIFQTPSQRGISSDVHGPFSFRVQVEEQGGVKTYM
jgi:hypothetical protein